MSDRPPGDDDPLARLGRREDARSPQERSGDLATDIAARLHEPPGLLEVVPDADEMAWLVRDGVRIAYFNAREATRLGPESYGQMLIAFHDLVRRFDELHPVIDALEVGHRYRVDYKHEKLRRTFRAKGTLLAPPEFRPAEGVTGMRWTLRIEVRPRFGSPAIQSVDSDVLTEITPT